MTKLKTSQCLYDFAILTDKYQFFQGSINTKYKDITSDLWLKLRHMFMPFKFDIHSKVVVTSNISIYEPIAFYLKLLSEHIGFDMKFTSQEKIVTRISAYHPSYLNKQKITKFSFRDVNILWKKILANQRCPWITEIEDSTLKVSYLAYQHRMKYLRLGVYYMLVKQHLYLKFKNSKGYRKKHQLT